jgi:hypothetical protein
MLAQPYVLKGCFGAAYIHALLSKAFHIRASERVLVFSNNVSAPDGTRHQVNWVLGALLAEVIHKGPGKAGGGGSPGGSSSSSSSSSGSSGGGGSSSGPGEGESGGSGILGRGGGPKDSGPTTSGEGEGEGGGAGQAGGTGGRAAPWRRRALVALAAAWVVVTVAVLLLHLDCVARVLSGQRAGPQQGSDDAEPQPQPQATVFEAADAVASPLLRLATFNLPSEPSPSRTPMRLRSALGSPSLEPVAPAGQPLAPSGFFASILARLHAAPGSEPAPPRAPTT